MHEMPPSPKRNRTDFQTEPSAQTAQLALAKTPRLVTAELQLRANASEAAAFLKAIAHRGRLMVLCNLIQGEKTVTQLEILLDSRQATVSQHLSRLRTEGLVTYRRDGKLIYYALAGEKSHRIIETLCDLFHQPNDAQDQPTTQ